MILYGGRLSPFVRRVELWLAMQERLFERRYLSAFAPNFDGLMSVNPLGRVPALGIGPDENLYETSAIIDYLEDTAAASKRLLPASGSDRWHTMQIMALSHGITEKSIALYYENKRRSQQYQWDEWQARLETQVQSGLDALNILMPQTHLASAAIQIAACCAYDINKVMFPNLVDAGLVRLRAISENANALPAFARTYPALA